MNDYVPSVAAGAADKHPPGTKTVKTVIPNEEGGGNVDAAQRRK